MKYFLVSVAQLVRAGQGSCVVTPVGDTGLVAPNHALSGGHNQSGALQVDLGPRVHHSGLYSVIVITLQ